MLLLSLLFLVVSHEIVNGSEVEEDTLEMVFALFRHGHRTNDPLSTYPKDPYKNYPYLPYGWGQLTNQGKMREYTLGNILHERYGKFVGMYTPDVVDPLATDYNRTKMSLELVLASLFPPEDPLDWNKDLNWQPVPYNYLTSNTDLRMGFPSKCAERSKLIGAYEQSPEGQEMLLPYKKWFGYLNNNTGLNIKGFTDLYILYFGLVSEDEWGLKLPEWVKPVYPDILREAAIDEYLVWSATPEISKLQGFNLKTILDAVNQKIDGTLNPPDRKLWLFSAHEMNVALMLNSLNAFYRHIPPYGACIMFELHKINDEYGFKIYYETHTGGPPADITVPGCDHFCPIDKFVELLKDHIPESDAICENGSSTSGGILD